MKPIHGSYRIWFSGASDLDKRELVCGKDFRLDEEGFSTKLFVHLRPLERDLFRLGMAVYVVDRIVRRYRRTNSRSLTRQVELLIEVSDPDFWNAQSDLLRLTLRQISDDFWTVRFVRGGAPHMHTIPLPLGPQNPVVCLYSGGLDSVAGLAYRLLNVARPVVTVTALHQHGQKARVTDQVNALARAFGRTVTPFVLRTTMVNPPALKHQELSQRCRSFLFASIGGAVASLLGSADVEVYESGVGAINLPPMAGMVSGGRSTKGCHPQFLRLMGKLVSQVAQRRITFSLPFRFNTKAEVVRSLLGGDLPSLAHASVSCVHYPLRERGAKQCGVCMGCIGRRQALISSGVGDESSAYKYDLFGGNELANAIPERLLMPLKAMLIQVVDLEDLTPDGQKPELFRRYLFGTQVLADNEPVLPWVEVLQRYRQEWLDLVATAHGQDFSWAKLMAEAEFAA